MDRTVDIKKVQDVLFDMAKCISSILEKNNIPYMIAFGTLLGAVRHKGFIPWDDDFDFYLFDDTYDYAIKVLRDELPNNCFVEDEKTEPLYFHSWAHVKDLNSETYCDLFPQDNLYAHKGLSIDLYRTRCMPVSKIESFLNKENFIYINKRKEKGIIDDREYKIRMEVARENQKFLHNCENDKILVYDLVPLYKCHYMKASSVFPLRRYKFLDYLFYGPNDANDILTDIYGNYMKMPPIEMRTTHYSFVKFFD